MAWMVPGLKMYCSCDSVYLHGQTGDGVCWRHILLPFSWYASSTSCMREWLESDVISQSRTGSSCCSCGNHSESSPSAFPGLYLWGSPFWVRFLPMFFNRTIEVVTFCLRGWPQWWKLVTLSLFMCMSMCVQACAFVFLECLTYTVWLFSVEEKMTCMHASVLTIKYELQVKREDQNKKC